MPLLIGQAKNNMSQSQYLRFLEKEIQKINKKIDFKIMKGEEYSKEARDHRLLLKKVRFHTTPSLSVRIVNLFFRKSLYA